MKYPLSPMYNALRLWWELRDASLRLIASNLTETDAQTIAETMNRANPMEVTVRK